MADTKQWTKDRIDAGAEKAKQLTDQASQAAQSTKEAASNLVSSATDKAKEMASSVAQTMGDVKDRAKEWTSSAAQGIGHAAESVRDTAAHAYDVSCEATREAGRELTGFMRRYPIPSLLVGLGLGFLVGRMTRRSF